MNILFFILRILAFTIVILVAYNLLKMYLLSKINVKHKWIVLIAAILFLILPAFLKINPNSYVSYIFSGIFLITFLWYLDLKGFMKRVSDNKKNRNKKDDIIKPKPKKNKAMKNQKKD